MMKQCLHIRGSRVTVLGWTRAWGFGGNVFSLGAIQLVRPSGDLYKGIVEGVPTWPVDKRGWLFFLDVGEVRKVELGWQMGHVVFFCLFFVFLKG